MNAGSSTKHARYPNRKKGSDFSIHPELNQAANNRMHEDYLLQRPGSRQNLTREKLSSILRAWLVYSSEKGTDGVAAITDTMRGFANLLWARLTLDSPKQTCDTFRLAAADILRLRYRLLLSIVARFRRSSK